MQIVQTLLSIGLGDQDAAPTVSQTERPEGEESFDALMESSQPETVDLAALIDPEITQSDPLICTVSSVEGAESEATTPKNDAEFEIRGMTASSSHDGEADLHVPAKENAPQALEDPNTPPLKTPIQEDTSRDEWQRPLNPQLPASKETTIAVGQLASLQSPSVKTDSVPQDIDTTVVKTATPEEMSSQSQPKVTNAATNPKSEASAGPKSHTENQLPNEEPRARPNITSNHSTPVQDTLSLRGDTAQVPRQDAVWTNQTSPIGTPAARAVSKTQVTNFEPTYKAHVPKHAAETHIYEPPLSKSEMHPKISSGVSMNTAQPVQIPLGQNAAVETKQASPLDIERDDLVIEHRAVANLDSKTVPTLRQPIDLPKHIAQQVLVAIRATPDKPVEMTLNPEELGRLRMVLQTEANTANVVLQFERPETLDLMRRHIDLLSQEMRELGYEKISFSFQQQSSGQSGEDTDQPHQSKQRHSLSEIEQETQSAIQIQLGSGSGLDIRL